MLLVYEEKSITKNIILKYGGIYVEQEYYQNVRIR